MITKYQSNRLLNYNFGGTAYANPSNYYIGLSTTNITEDGSNVTEPQDTAYQRAKIKNDKTVFSVASDGELHVLQEVTFPEASQPWGVIKDVFISDSPTGGQVLYYDTLETQRNIDVDYEVTFPVGTIKIKMVSE